MKTATFLKAVKLDSYPAIRYSLWLSTARRQAAVWDEVFDQNGVSFKRITTDLEFWGSTAYEVVGFEVLPALA